MLNWLSFRRLRPLSRGLPERPGGSGRAGTDWPSMPRSPTTLLDECRGPRPARLVELDCWLWRCGAGGVTVLMICPSVKTSPFQGNAIPDLRPLLLRGSRRWTTVRARRGLRSWPPRAWPASAAIAIGVTWRLWRSKKLVTIRTMMVVSAVWPRYRLSSNGNPVRSTSRPTTICGWTWHSLEQPTVRRSSSGSSAKYNVVAS